MSRKQVDNVWMVISVFFFLLLSSSFLMMPLEGNFLNGSLSYTIIAGIIFWISLIGGISTQLVLSYRRKKWYEIHRIRKAKSKRKIGLICFFENTYASIFDIIFILSLIGTIIVMIAMQRTEYFCYIIISVLVFSFCMHCILNGRIFFHLVHQNRMLQSIEKERANSTK